MLKSESKSSHTPGILSVFGHIDDDEELKLFVKKLKEFDTRFCGAMIKGSEFNIRLEVRGSGGHVVHVRTYEDDLEKPLQKSKKI